MIAKGRHQQLHHIDAKVGPGQVMTGDRPCPHHRTAIEQPGQIILRPVMRHGGHRRPGPGCRREIEHRQQEALPLLPGIAIARRIDIVARTGDPYAGLWYTIAVVALALVTCLVALPETKGRPLDA